MPAAYNINNKYLARLVMERMEALYLLVAEQGGGRKKHQASHQVLNRVLVSDLLRIYRLAGFLCMNDAIQCYDRIIHAIVSICLRRAKVAWNFIVCLLLVLQLARHSILTGFGLSEVTYGGILELLILMGVMQGNGAGPLFWLLISSGMYEVQRLSSRVHLRHNQNYHLSGGISLG